MIRLVVASSLGLWIGLTMLLSVSPWGRRLSLAERLRPHAPGTPTRRGAGLLSADSARQSFGPLATAVGSQIARAFGVQEELNIRLTRVHSDLDATGFRLRQVGISAAVLAVTIGLALVWPMPALLIAILLLSGPITSFLVIEQQLSTRSSQWQRRLFLESPIVAEQIAMHLASGASLGNALSRTTTRGSGAIATDLQDVLLRIRQGLSESDALTEWAVIANVPAVSRLVSVLGLHGEAGDLARIVSDEAKSLRREVHRELIATVESRNQQVWIPVTISALVPGVIVLAVPFLTALRDFSS
jgi:tight adherence protein C